jgi:hypothetical protein
VGCKCIKWTIIIVLIAALLALVIAIIIIAVALHGTQTLQDIVKIGFQCVIGKDCKWTSPGIFYKVMKEFIVEESYEWSCVHNIVDGDLEVKWAVAFEMADNQSLGIEIIPADGKDDDEILKAHFDFQNPVKGAPPSTVLDEFWMERGIIEHDNVDLMFSGKLINSGEIPISENKGLCETASKCKGKLVKLWAHFTLKFRNVPDWLCFRFDREVTAVDFLYSLAKAFRRVWKDAGDAIEGLLISDFLMPNGSANSVDDPTGLENPSSKYCAFSTTYEKR